MTLEEMLALIKSGGELGDNDPASIINEAISKASTTATSSLDAKNKQLLAKLKTAQDANASLPENFDPELWETLIGDHNKSAEDKLKAEQQWETLKLQLIEQHKTELASKDELMKKLESALSTQLVDNAAVTSMIKEKGNPVLLLPHVKAQLKMVSGDDGYSAIVVDQKGDQRFSVVKPGEVMSVEELVNEFKTKPEFAGAFEATNSGGGTHGNQGDGTTKNPFMRGETYNMTEQVKLKKSNPALAEQMRVAATK